MKKQILLALAIVLLGMQAYAESVKLNVHVKNHSGKEVSIVTINQQFKFELNSENKGSLDIDITKPSWARFSYMSDAYWLFLYLTPGNDVNIELDVAQFNRIPTKLSYPTTVECQDGGITNFLVKYQKETAISFWAPFEEKDAALSGAEKVARFDEIEKRYHEEINKAGIAEEYHSALNGFVTYGVGRSFLNFIYEKMRSKQLYIQDDAYYAKMESLIKEVPEMIGLKNYHDYMKNALLLKYDKGELKPVEYYTLAAKENLKLINTYIVEYISKYGLEGTEELQELFLKQNTDPRAKQWLEGFVAEFSGLAKGTASPIFNYEDIDGEMVSLDDLKGKYVYIDMWATWCGPCRAEIPHLEKLEHDYAGKNIFFVSISNDRPEDKEKWKALVKEKNMGGIQLFANGDNELGMAYKVQGIPRFILLDKQGNIVESIAPKPSDPKVRELFNSLEGL